MILSLTGEQHPIKLRVVEDLAYPQTPKVISENDQMKLYGGGGRLIIKNPTLTQKFLIVGYAQGQLDIPPITSMFYFLLTAILLYVWGRKDLDIFSKSDLLIKIVLWGSVVDWVLTILFSYYTEKIVLEMTGGVYRQVSEFNGSLIFFFVILLCLLLLNVKKGMELQKEQELVV